MEVRKPVTHRNAFMKAMFRADADKKSNDFVIRYSSRITPIIKERVSDNRIAETVTNTLKTVASWVNLLI